MEDDIVFQQGVRPDDDADAAVLEPGVDAAALLLRGAADQQRALHGRGCQVLPDVGAVLAGEDLGRRHDAGLVAVADGDQAAEHGHHRLAGAHVPLQQAVHLAAADQVGADFLDHALLGAGQAVGESVVAGVEVRPDLGHRDAVFAARADVFLLEERQLQEEQLLELQAVGGLLQGIAVRREVDVLEGVRQRDEPALAQDILRERLLDLRQAERQGGGLQLAHHLAGDPARLELLRTRIHAGQGPLGHRPVLRHVHLRVYDVHPGPEGLRLAEEQESAPGG